MIQKNEKKLLKALEDALVYAEKLNINNERRLWNKITSTGSLEQMLSSLTKNELDKIRKKYQLKSVSSLKKAELVAELVKTVPLQFEKFSFILDKNLYTLIKKMIKNGGWIHYNKVFNLDLNTLMYYCIAFPGIRENKKVLYMPQELMQVMQNVDARKLQDIVNRNTEWTQITFGMVYYYGILEYDIAIKKIEAYTHNKIDFHDYLEVMSLACEIYDKADYNSLGFIDDRIINPKDIFTEQWKRPEIDYYPFTKKQLIEASVPDYIDKTPELNRFLLLLSEHYDLSEEDLDEFALIASESINNEMNIMGYFTYLQEVLELPSLEFTQLLADKLVELHNNTRLWMLKGYTPRELSRRGKTELKPMVNKSQPKSNVVHLTNQIKIGRNEPCSCGSGKKYKNCCGK